LWRGRKSPVDTAKIECELDINEGNSALQYLVSFKGQPSGGFVIDEERINGLGARGAAATPLLNRRDGQLAFGRSLARGSKKNGGGPNLLVPTESVLGGFRYAAGTPEISAVARALEKIHIYRNFDTFTEPDAKAGARRSVSTSYLSSNELAEDGYNLPLILSRMRIAGTIKKVEEYLRRFSERFGEIHVDVAGGTARIYIVEQGLRRPTPGLRLSDGTLKLLCLLAVLFDSESEQSLICLDEPETGLHPDAVRLVARAINERAQQQSFDFAACVPKTAVNHRDSLRCPRRRVLRHA
jgi:predicted ATPase